MNRAVKGGGIALSAVTFMIWTGVTASAETETSDAQDTVAAINDVASSVLETAIDVSASDSAISTSAGVNVDLSTDASEGISIDSPTGGDLEIGLPFADTAGDAQVVDGVMVYENGNGSSTTPLVHADGSVQILTTIANANAPIAYEYQVSLAPGSTLSAGADGGVAILDAQGGVTGYVEAPWAYDANGATVPTRYEVVGDKLIQVVSHTAVDTVYPVVADPSISFGWAIYVKYSKDDVKTVTDGLGGAINDKAKFGLILCGKIPHSAAKAGCALVGTSCHTSIYNTFNDAKANGKCVEIQLAYISYLPVVWKTYSC